MADKHPQQVLNTLYFYNSFIQESKTAQKWQNIGLESILTSALSASFNKHKRPQQSDMYNVSGEYGSPSLQQISSTNLPTKSSLGRA